MQNLVDVLGGMDYPGRGIIAGRNDLGHNVFAYFLTGRSEPSKARVLKAGPNTGVISTECTDLKQLETGSRALLIYPAIIPSEKGVVMSNGSQTNLLYSFLESGENLLGGDKIFHSQKSKLVALDAFRKPNFLYDAQKDRFIDQASYEPDAPNNTPRINLVSLRNGGCFHHIFRNDLNRPEQRLYPFDFVNGEGRLLTTYTGQNIEPLPSFTGEPVLGTIGGFRTVAQTADAIYGALNPKYRIAVAAIHIDPQNGKIIDRHIINPAREADKI